MPGAAAFLRDLRKSYPFSLAALRGGGFCLPSACRDAPLGQRQGGVFRFPPPYLWTPPTPQRAKGCTPLTILKQKSKHKKASAAPVGAIALTLFSLLHKKPLSRCATDSSLLSPAVTSSPGRGKSALSGERARPQALHFSWKLYRYAKGSPFGRAVTAGD